MPSCSRRYIGPYCSKNKLALTTLSTYFSHLHAHCQLPGGQWWGQILASAGLRCSWIVFLTRSEIHWSGLGHNLLIICCYNVCCYNVKMQRQPDSCKLKYTYSHNCRQRKIHKLNTRAGRNTNTPKQREKYQLNTNTAKQREKYQLNTNTPKQRIQIEHYYTRAEI